MSVEETGDFSFDDGGAKRRARRAVWAIAVVIVAWIGWGVINAVLEPRGDPGRLEESLVSWPEARPLPSFTDVTDDWGLSEWRNTAGTQLSGGVGAADLDADGLLDIVTAGGDVAVFFNVGGTFTRATGRVPGLRGDAISIGLADLDADLRVDVMIGTAVRDVFIVWGGRWVEARDLSAADVTRLPGGDPTTGLLELPQSNSRLLDVVRLSYGQLRPATDVIFRQQSPRQFEVEELPTSDWRSMAGEVVDIDGDDELDIWVTRDVGWREGSDSIYSRTGDGTWQDVGGDLNADLAIDGMGVAIADLNGDGLLDAYLSDLGDNEMLVGTPDGFITAHDTGAARIRPPGAARDSISSSWASGVADLNLDGQLDLFVTNGGFPLFAVDNKISGTTVALDDPPAVLLGVGGGRFAEVWPDLGLRWVGAARGLAIGDFDGDGDSDVIISRLAGSLVALRNDTKGPSVRVVARPGCEPTGAVVTVRAGLQSETSLLRAHTFLGVHAPEVIVGVPRGELSIRVVWPGGSVTEEIVHLEGIHTTYEVDCGGGAREIP